SMKLNTACSAIVESDDNSAFTIGSGVTYNFTNHSAHVGVVGGWAINGQASIMDASTSPAVAESPINITSPGDPLARVLDPSTSNVTTTTIRSANPVQYKKNSMPAGN